MNSCLDTGALKPKSIIKTRDGSELEVVHPSSPRVMSDRPHQKQRSRAESCCSNRGPQEHLEAREDADSRPSV